MIYVLCFIVGFLAQQVWSLNKKVIDLSERIYQIEKVTEFGREVV